MATRFQQLAILDAGGTNLLTRATTKTTIDVFAEGLGGIGQSIFRDGTHQIQPAAWSVVFVASYYIGWASLETEPAVNAGEKFLFLLS
jgi:hypothetical protein